MLNGIVRFAVRFRGVVIALACVVTGYGLWTLLHARLDVFPEFAPPMVTIETEALGLSPEQVEAIVTQPLEDALNGASGLRNLRSRSIQGLSYITLTFASGSNVYRDRQSVSERLGAAAGSLPVGVKSPVMLPLISATKLVAIMGITSKTRSLMHLRTVADWVLKPQLLSVPGVAGVAIFGRDQQQLQIEIHPAALARYGLSLDDVAQAARRATGVRGAGYIDTGNQNLVLVTQGQAASPQALAQVVLRHAHGQTLRLGDVADVRYAPAPPIGAAAIDGKPGVMLKVAMQYGANALAVTRALDQRLTQLQPALHDEGIELYPDIFRPASFITTALRNIATSLAIGAALVVAVLFLFLFNARTAVISVVAIPLSLLAGVILLDWLGAGINIMTLAGLAIALGEVVDDAIIDVENIFRRLRENRARPDPRPAFRVVVDASLEVRSAVVYATFTVAMIFLPVLTLTGVTGRLFSPLAFAYIASILASLLVALTVVPALSCVLLARRPIDQEETRLIRWLKRRHRQWLLGARKHARALMLGVGALCLAALAAIPLFKEQYLPELREGHFIVHMKLAPGASLEQGLRLGNRVSAAIAAIPGVQNVAQRVGRSSLLSGPAPSYSSEIQVELKPLSGGAQARVLGDLHRALHGFAGASFSINTFLSERIQETISGFTAPVVVNVFGNDLEALDSAAQRVAATLGRVRGARNVQIQAPQGSPQLTIRLRERALARWGIAPVDALDAIQTAYQGMRVAQVYVGTRVFDVSVIFPPAERRDPTAVGSLLLRNPGGILVPLRDVADIRVTSGRFMILHEAAQRVQTVTAYVSGRSVTGFTNQARNSLRSQANLPRGTYAVFSGAAEARAQAARDLLLKTALAIAAIAMLLFMALRSVRALLLVLVNLPFALVGGVVTVLLTGGVLSIGSLVGFVTLFGITVRNSIMLISHYKHLVGVEGVRWDEEAAIRGAQERLVPILMTALVTALGLLPLAVTSGAPGNEIEGPMASIILGGLITSTILNLLVLPVLALRYGRFAPVPAGDELVEPA